MFVWENITPWQVVVVGGLDSLALTQTISSLKIGNISFRWEAMKYFLLHKYYYFLKMLLVDEKQVQLGLILSFSYFL